MTEFRRADREPVDDAGRHVNLHPGQVGDILLRRADDDTQRPGRLGPMTRNAREYRGRRYRPRVNGTNWTGMVCCSVTPSSRFSRIVIHCV
jgi:hypothetical protein